MPSEDKPRAPDFYLYRGVDRVTAQELIAEGPILLHFYLFSFTGGPEGG